MATCRQKITIGDNNSTTTRGHQRNDNATTPARLHHDLPFHLSIYHLYYHFISIIFIPLGGGGGDFSTGLIW